MKEIGYMPLNGGIMGQVTSPQKDWLQPVHNQSFWFLANGQLATGLITIDCNWQLQSSCDQLQSSPVASLCTSCQLDFRTLILGLAWLQPHCSADITLNLRLARWLHADQLSWHQIQAICISITSPYTSGGSAKQHHTSEPSWLQVYMWNYIT